MTQVSITNDMADLINEKFKENTEQHDAILRQVVNTNGRVRKLESWRMYMMGALSVISFLLIGIVPILYYILQLLKK
jgi:hypothetical protein